MSEPVSFGARLRALAEERGADVALVLAAADGSEQALTFEEFERWTNRAARMLQREGVGTTSTVVVGYPNSVEHLVATWAAWKCGALVLPLNPRAPAPERDALLEVARPTVTMGEWGPAAIERAALQRLDGYPEGPLPDVVPHPGKAVGSGGSTGTPKVIVDPSPWSKVPGAVLGTLGDLIGFPDVRVQLIPGPLYHNIPFGWSSLGLFEGQTVILMDSFDEARVIDLVERHRVEFMVIVPTMMRRIATVPGVASRDWSSIAAILHSAAPCPAAVKRAWLDLLGPERVFEGFGATEGNGIVLIRGDEWLDHPGSVGRPFESRIRIVGEDGRDLGPGEIGEIFMGPETPADTYVYLGAPPARTTQDGLVSVGDLGWVDDQGYVYLADRRTDLIITGGSNVYPAEVEQALVDHPSVADAVVIGIPDDDWGKRVHAIVEPLNPSSPPHHALLDQHCRSLLAPSKCPKSYEFLTRLPRDDAGKIRRSQLAATRAPTAHPAD